MREQSRIPRIVSKLTMLWQLHPDLRFGQLMALVESRMGELTNTNLFYIEDDVWENFFNEIVEEELR